MEPYVRSKTAFLHLPFEVIPALEKPAQMGLVTLETDLTIETEMRHFLSGAPGHEDASGVVLLQTRIACDDQVTAKNLTMMEGRFFEALALFPNAYSFDVIGYGCTSASLLIGENRVQEIIQSQVNVAHVTTPLTAAKRGFAALGVHKIGYLAPYVSEISNQMCEELGEAGFVVSAAATFGEGRDSVVGCISPTSILEAIAALLDRDPKVEAVFVSCTSLKCAPIIAKAEAQFRIPILSSNSAIAWDMARLAQVPVSAAGKGKLFLKL
ncbi:MAG: Asp/Glu racemase [Paracoccaceae bacterium]|nr:Asp/Glu racemase [Paracoccaceae bacterium]